MSSLNTHKRTALAGIVQSVFEFLAKLSWIHEFFSSHFGHECACVHPDSLMIISCPDRRSAVFFIYGAGGGAVAVDFGTVISFFSVSFDFIVFSRFSQTCSILSYSKCRLSELL